ncbi:hypothetical protein N9N97_00505 [Rickettsiaceae bacterium]|nr:hypothetical protein [Rickettsiaceae bacterium]
MSKLKQQGEAIEAAIKSYNKKNISECAEFLVRTCPDQLIAPIDILTKIIHFKYGANELEVGDFVTRCVVQLKSHLPYDKHLMLVLIKEISETSFEVFQQFLMQNKSENALAQLQEAMPQDAFASMLAMFSQSSLEDEGKEEVLEVVGDTEYYEG